MSRTQNLLVWAALMASGNAQAGYISIVGSTPNTPLAGVSSTGSSLTGAYVDAYYANDPTWPSTFSGNFLVMGNGTAQSAPIAFNTVPFVTGLLSELYFMFTFDAQETQQGVPLALDSIRLLVNGSAVWSMTSQLLINQYVDGSGNPILPLPDSADWTTKPLGNGADLSVFIPVWFLNGLNLTGSSTFIFEVTESLNSNGNDEWKLVTGAYPGTSFFQPNAPISSPVPPVPVPEPSAGVPLVLAAAYYGRKRLRRDRGGATAR